jgi:hypothetical protein
MGPAVGLFTISDTTEDILVEPHLDLQEDVNWSRSDSLLTFTQDDEGFQGSGIGATILDGKKCLQGITENTRSILFGKKSGLYYHSDDRKVVIILFDDPKGHGVIFVQAP